MDKFLFINNMFWTFQGEGKNWGRRALFVRMPYCNLACSWCDTTFNTYIKMTVDDFVAKASEEVGRFAVVTGGEPLMHRHTPVVVRELKKLGFEVAVETNGSFAMPADCPIDFVTCSPKRDNEYHIHEDLYSRVNEFKYVVDEGFDFTVLAKHDDDTYKTHSLSPEFGRFKESLAEIMSYIATHPRWRISLQTHKFMEIP